ncbi:alpha/beta fold hydrolase [Halorubraceae archaeon YAN]|nr:alpha/beta fold hydrolase [Halorubraceae archaeon YAN]
MTRRNPKNFAQKRLKRPARDAYSTRRVEFPSPHDADPDDRDLVVGTLYLPDRPKKPPVIVMAPGLGMWRTFGYPAYAERFAKAGYAVLLFDYRHHNESEGAPRSLIDATKQQQDYEAAIKAVKRLHEVDGNRVVLWGFSLSGGHVLATAADRYDVSAVIATCPFTDGRSVIKSNIKRPKYLLGSIGRGIRDRLGSFVGFGRTVPIVGDPGSGAVVDTPGARRAFLDLVDRESNWNNKTPARLFLWIARYRPIIQASNIRAPTLLIGGTEDEITPVDNVAAAANAIENSTFVRFPGTHFSIFAEDFEQTIGHQLTFLADVFSDDRSTG